MKLSTNFSLKEFTASQTAVRRSIKNVPGTEEIYNLKKLVRKVLQPLRTYFGPVIITSGYRSKKLNKKIGGVSSSQHIKGEAADFHIVGENLKTVFNFIIQHLEFDQLIYEFDSWIHVSYSTNNRNQILKSEKINGKTVYTNISCI